MEKVFLDGDGAWHSSSVRGQPFGRKRPNFPVIHTKMQLASLICPNIYPICRFEMQSMQERSQVSRFAKEVVGFVNLLAFQRAFPLIM
jgi:hypothetical protein